MIRFLKGGGVVEKERLVVEQEIRNYEQLLKQKPNDAYLLRWLAFKYSQLASFFEKTDPIQYQKKLIKAIQYLELATRYGYEGLANEHFQLWQKLKSQQIITMQKVNAKNPFLKAFLLIALGLFILFCSSVGWFLFDINEKKSVARELPEMRTSVPPIDEKELTLIDTNQHRVSYLRIDEGIEESEGYKRAKERIELMRESALDESLEVVILQRRNGFDYELGSVSVSKSQIEPLIAKRYKKAATLPVDQDAFSLTILRSAIYHYVLNTKQFPHSLEELTQPFPNNYLSSIPKDQQFSQNEIKQKYDGTGGWVYEPQQDLNLNTLTMSELRQVISESVYPNFYHTCTKGCTFQPIEIHIDQSIHKLSILIGGVSFGEMSVGIGKYDATPEGSFYISKRVAFPNHQLQEKNRYFGTRGMELSGLNVAIHGTYVEESIGRSLSNGCIRLFNKDIEKLFEVIPLFTTVFIENGNISGSDGHVVDSLDGNQGKPFDNIIPSIAPFANGSGGGREMDAKTIYEWLN
ncbi:L,D-transpeptidase [Ureibacillus manganicus]|uniref:L,D-TPase catalytic domain-containing protein n=1 Tax=Ureibacillus manganicus DSM 26584 TaxID=1384049 RepID=A0A0A3IT41_9BACL|nr:L,D-transpeptidase [Ureibacillus manganicus]KGR77997.1 hypothetical protein CD29_12620 [Ureibacillus manganicus DSM 26584]